jgi:pyrroloquinoline quinone biosynthesis protein E
MTAGLRLEELILEVTNACHHRCLHCSTKGGIPIPGELTQQERLRVLNEACDLRLFELRLLGGDPLFRLGDTIELLRVANARGVQKSLVYTSAVQSDLSWLEVFASFSPIKLSAEASIYSASPSVHDAITLKKGSLGQLLVNSYEAVRVGFDLNWNFVWMKPNFHDLESVMDLAAQVGIKRVRVLRLMLNGRARDHQSSLELTAQMADLCPQVLDNLSQKFPSVRLACSKPLEFQLSSSAHGESPGCSAGGAQLIVQADGVVLPCIGLKDTPSLRIGDVREESLRQIFLRSRGMQFDRVSNEIHECPAILYQQQPNLIQVSL